MEYGTKEWFEHMFSRAAQGEDLWGHQWRAIQKYRYLLTLSLVRDRLAARDGQRILDLGCGLGDFTALLHAENPANEVYGSDIVETAVETASRTHPAIHFTTGVLPEIPLEGRFEGIAALECINYLDPEGRRETMRNVAAKLAESGWFLFSGHLGQDPGDRRYFSEQDVVTCMEAAGFSIEQRIYNYAALYNKLESPFLRVVNLSAKIDAARSGGTSEPERIQRLLRVLSVPVFGAIARIGIGVSGAVCKVILRSLQPMGFITFTQTLSRSFLGERGKSHIIVLGVKRRRTE